jgi:uncharacterized HAD superfamily protein
MNRVAIDIDEVLVPFVKPMAKWRGLKMPPSNTRYKYVYREMFNITEEESRQMVEEFYRSPEFVQLQPIRHSQVGIVRLRGQSKKLYAVTGRQDSAREKTELWLDQHFPGMFDDLIITNSYTEHEIKKVDVCKSLALNLIIDDNIDTCIECAQSGIRARNFVGHEEMYPWCEHTGMSMYGWK